MLAARLNIIKEILQRSIRIQFDKIAALKLRGSSINLSAQFFAATFSIPHQAHRVTHKVGSGLILSARQLIENELLQVRRE